MNIIKKDGRIEEFKIEKLSTSLSKLLIVEKGKSDLSTS